MLITTFEETHKKIKKEFKDIQGRLEHHFDTMNKDRGTVQKISHSMNSKVSVEAFHELQSIVNTF